MMHNPNTCFESYNKNDMIGRKMEVVVIHDLMNENLFFLRWYGHVRQEDGKQSLYLS